MWIILQLRMFSGEFFACEYYTIWKLIKAGNRKSFSRMKVEKDVRQQNFTVNDKQYTMHASKS